MKKPDLIPGLRAALRIVQARADWYYPAWFTLIEAIKARIAREKKARKRAR